MSRPERDRDSRGGFRIGKSREAKQVPARERRARRHLPDRSTATPRTPQATRRAVHPARRGRRVFCARRRCWDSRRAPIDTPQSRRRSHRRQHEARQSFRTTSRGHDHGTLAARGESPYCLWHARLRLIEATETVVRLARLGQGDDCLLQRALCVFNLSRRGEALCQRQASVFVARGALNIERTLKRRHSLVVTPAVQQTKSLGVESGREHEAPRRDSRAGARASRTESPEREVSTAARLDRADP